MLSLRYLCLYKMLCVTTGEEHVTIQAYKAEQEDEISLEVGETVEVIHKLLDGWWVVRCVHHCSIHITETCCHGWALHSQNK